MALPNKITVNAITGTSLPSTIDNDINTGIKQPLVDILGIPDNTNVSNAVMEVVADGLKNVRLRDAGANPANAGYLQRNGTLLNFYDGTANRVLVSRNLAETLTNKSVLATGSTTARTLESRFVDILNVKDFGAVLDDVADDTTAIQAAITAAGLSGASVFVSAGVGRTTAPLLTPKPVRIVGVGANPYTSGPNASGARGLGSWLHFDHTGKGISATPTTNSYASLTLQSIGTFRTQPVPGPGWAPTAHDFDIWTVNVDLQIDDVTLLNPTKGIYISAVAGVSGYNRATISRLRGQPLQVGIEVESAFDVVNISQVSFWAYWKDHADVMAYMLANLKAMALYRCDNPLVQNFFSISAAYGIYFGQGAAGKTSKFHGSNIDLDRGYIGIYVDPATDGVTAQFSNLTVQGEGGLASTTNVYVRGDNAVLDFANTWLTNAYGNNLRVDGTNNVLHLTNLHAQDWDQATTGFPGIEVSVGNTVVVEPAPLMSTSGGATGPKYGGVGIIYTDDHWIEYTPATVASSAGTITTVGTKAANYHVRGDQITVNFAIVITTNGTGSGGVTVTLPFTAIATGTVQYYVGAGKEMAINGKALTFTITPGDTTVLIRDYNNAYPALDGALLAGTICYRKAS